MDLFTSPVNYVSTCLQCKLKNGGFITRPNAESGAWMAALLPAAVILGAFSSSDISQQYQRTGVFSIGLLISSTLCIYDMNKTKHFSNNVFMRSHFLLASVIITGVTFFMLLPNISMLISIIGGLFCSLSYTYGVKSLLISCQKCLTFGEASVLVQAIILFVISATDKLYEMWYSTPDLCMDVASTILEVGLFGIGFICLLVYKYPVLRTTVPFYGVCASIISIFIILFLHIILKQSPVLWILHFLFVESLQRLGLMIYWIGCSAVAFWAVASQIQGMTKASTVVRKYLHILAVAVYIPGLIQDCCLLYLASGIVLALFIVLEVFRLLSMPPIGAVLQDGFLVYSDEKDQGGLALTPIYLLAGCSLPLWLHPSADSSRHLLPLLSGVLSIGVGDTAASVCGTWFGKHRWPGGTRKTIEGTLACIFSQLLVVLALIFLGYIDNSVTLILKSVFAIVVTSLVEAKTDQVDNLALPLIMYNLLI